MMPDQSNTSPQLRDFVESTLVMSGFLNDLIVKIDQGKCPSPEKLREDALIALGLAAHVRAHD
jgi:hypothetical protein